VKLKVYLIILLSLSAGRILSQDGNEEAFKKTFRSELKTVEAKLTRKPNDPSLNYKYGLLCFKLCRYREAQRTLYKCMGQNQNNPLYFLDLYHVEIALKNTKQANEYFYKYLSLKKNLAANSDYVHKYQELNSEIKPKLVTTDLSSIDFYPFVLANGKIKYLTLSKYTYQEPTSPMLFRNYLTDEVVFNDTTFNKPKIVKQPGKTSDGFSYNTFCLNKAMNKIYMSRYDGGNRRMIICVSEKEGLKWNPFRVITYIAKHAKYNFLHPMLTENEDQLVFASDLPGGSGGYDLWIADLNETGEIKKVKNLGNKVNTLGNECFPSLYDQNSFFFSSDGHHGFGSLDLYRCDIGDKGVSSPINLGPSFNTNRDEYGLFYTADHKTAFFTSNRSVSNANLYIDKIYKIKLNVFDCEILDLEIKNPFVKTEEVPVIADIPTPTNPDNRSTQESIGSSVSGQNLASAPVPANEEPPIETTQPEIISQPAEITKSMVERAIESSKAILNSSSEVENTPKSATERVDLYEIKNDKIEEKFVQYADNVSITNQKTNHIVENKFWTTAKLVFKDLDIPISYSYCRVINPRNEVIYSNYTTQNGMISIEVVESNEYTIEIPRFKTMLGGVVFSIKGENTFYLPYESTAQAKSTNQTTPLNKDIRKDPVVKKPTKDKRQKSKPPRAKGLASAPGLSIAKSSKLSNSTTKSSSPAKTSPPKKASEKKNAPKNMLENFN
jgi:hypothetical protein